MGIVDWFICDLENPGTVLARDLITMAVIDGEFTTMEKKELIRICEQENITNTALCDTLRGSHLNVAPHVPSSKQERVQYISYLVNMMEADEYCSPLEVHTLCLIAQKVGLSHMELIAILLKKLRDGQIEKKKEFKILESFVDSYIAIDNSDYEYKSNDTFSRKNKK